jgi:CubicO group peptidase (beta-lactamase class C family)
VFAVPLRAGGQFWVNGTGTLHLPRTAFSMNGAGGQYVIIDPENDLVIVTFHHRLGGVTGGAVRSLNVAFDLLPTAVPGFTIPAEAKL